jgi:hypothetical protein
VSCQDVWRDGDAYVDGELDAESQPVYSLSRAGSPSARRWAGSTTQRRIIRSQIVCARVWRSRRPDPSRSVISARRWPRRCWSCRGPTRDGL